MKLINTSFTQEKKSKFYGYLYEINDKDEIINIVNEIKNNNKGYRHLPYAYKLSNTAGKSNDKEPGDIGMNFLNILERNNLNSHILLVLRYFGGTKLGASNWGKDPIFDILLLLKSIIFRVGNGTLVNNFKIRFSTFLFFKSILI